MKSLYVTEREQTVWPRGGQVPKNLSQRSYRERASKDIIWDGSARSTEGSIQIYFCVGKLLKKQAETFNKPPCLGLKESRANGRLPRNLQGSLLCLDFSEEGDRGTFCLMVWNREDVPNWL